MSKGYGRDLDLNLLRAFVAVAELGSVTAAAAQLYVTQSAVSASLRRLATAIDAPLFARAGRALVLTDRGRRLLATARPHLHALVAAALSPTVFDPATSERTIRLGLADVCDLWLLPPLLRALATAAPRMRVIVVPIQFRTVAAALASGTIDAAVTVADDLPAGTLRRTLFFGSFVCLYDPRHARVGRPLTLARYLEHDHVIVSYNRDLRGVVEDLLGITRQARVSVPDFHGVGAVVEGSALLATVPAIVAEHLIARHRRLRTARLPPPMAMNGAAMELLWPRATDDDDALRFVRGHIERIAAQPRRRRRVLSG